MTGITMIGRAIDPPVGPALGQQNGWTSGDAGPQQGNVVENKIFIGGCSQSTTTESLNRHFSQYGPVDGIIMMDKSTGRSRGFGFCTFATQEALAQALGAPQVIDGHQVECAACVAKATRPTENKIFVGALSQASTTESLNAHFSQHGPADGIVMMDKATGRSRGFGFVSFPTAEAVNAVLRTEQVIDGKTVDCKVCSPKGEVQVAYKPCRIFVGGLPQTADEIKLRTFFSRYGPVADARVMTDKESNRSRGFGYVTFQTPQACELALANRTSNVIDDKWVEVKRCTEKMTAGGLGGKGAVGALAPQAAAALGHLGPQQLVQVAQLTAQLQGLLGHAGQPLLSQLPQLSQWSQKGIKGAGGGYKGGGGKSYQGHNQGQQHGHGQVQQYHEGQGMHTSGMHGIPGGQPAAHMYGGKGGQPQLSVMR